MTIRRAKEILAKQGLTWTDQELIFLVEMVNRGFDQFEKQTYGHTLKEMGLDTYDKNDTY